MPLRTPYGQPGPIGGGNGLESVYVSGQMLQGSGIFPLIPNLQFGLLYDWGKKVNSSRFTADYILPITLSPDSILFGEAHTEVQGFSSFHNGPGFNNKADLSVGGGLRTILGNLTLVGVNGFYDGSVLNKKWYSSGGIGFELAHKLTDSDAIDINFNWYGQLFTDVTLTNAFRAGPKNFDLEAGLSHELWEGGPDFRIKMTGYQFDTGTRVPGWNAGAEIKTRDGVISLKYDVGNDKLNKVYQTVGAFFNCGFQLDRLLSHGNPFTMPEPLFKSPCNIRRMLTRNVKRDWHQPGPVGRRAGCTGECCNLDRFFASVPMGPGVSPGTYVSNDFRPIPFADVPNACLDPTKNIVVDFDYAFDVAPTRTIIFNVNVSDITQFTNLYAFTPFLLAGQSGHMSITLDNCNSGASGNQTCFTEPRVDPSQLLSIGQTNNSGPNGTSSLTITNVAIHFNQ